MTQTKQSPEMAETAVAAVGVNAVAQPAGVGRGFENVNTSDITMPRAKLLQSNSPEVSDRDYEFRAGDIIHSLLMEKVPEKFIALNIFNSNIFFVPREDAARASVKMQLNLSDEDMAGAIICRAADGITGDRYGHCSSCGKCKFVGNEKPLCMQTINVLAVPVDEDGNLQMPVVLQFSSTSYKHGKKFRDTAFYSSLGGDLFDRVYKLEATESQANGNRWFEMKVKPAGLVPEELKSSVLALYNSFAGKNIVVDADEASDTNASSDIDY